MRPPEDDLRRGIIRDLQIDAESAREQAEKGPFYPERAITRESLLAYAEKCEREINALLSASRPEGEQG